jgi:hypothetical protein
MVQGAVPPAQPRRPHCFGPHHLPTVQGRPLTHPQAKPKNKMHTDPEKLSHHVHRVGHHFPLEIVNLACSKFGYVYDEEHGLRKDKSRERTNWIAQGVEVTLRGRSSTGVLPQKRNPRNIPAELFERCFPKSPRQISIPLSTMLSKRYLREITISELYLQSLGNNEGR